MPSRLHTNNTAELSGIVEAFSLLYDLKHAASISKVQKACQRKNTGTRSRALSRTRGTVQAAQATTTRKPENNANPRATKTGLWAQEESRNKPRCKTRKRLPRPQPAWLRTVGQGKKKSNLKADVAAQRRNSQHGYDPVSCKRPTEFEYPGPHGENSTQIEDHFEPHFQS